MCYEGKKRYSCGCVATMKRTRCDDGVDGAFCDVVMTDIMPYPVKCTPCGRKMLAAWDRIAQSDPANIRGKAVEKAQAKIDLTVNKHDVNSSKPESAPEPLPKHAAKKRKTQNHVNQEQQQQGKQTSRNPGVPKKRATRKAESKENERAIGKGRAIEKGTAIGKETAIKAAEVQRDQRRVEELDHFSVASWTDRVVFEAQVQASLDEELEAAIITAFDSDDSDSDSLFNDPPTKASTKASKTQKPVLPIDESEPSVFRMPLEQLIPCHGTHYKLRKDLPSIGQCQMCENCCTKIGVMGGQTAELVNCFAMFDSGYWSEAE